MFSSGHGLKHVALIASLLLLFVFIGLLLNSLPSAKFRKYIWHDLPPSTQIINVRDGDTSFGIFPEFTCYMHFTARREEIAIILSNRMAKPYTGNVPGGQGTPEIAAWWFPASPNQKMQLFSLDRRAVHRWKDPQFLWIDQTGTNCYYLYWGI